MEHSDSTSFLRQSSRTLLTIARAATPDLVISARFLKRGERNRLHALVAFGRVLNEILDPAMRQSDTPNDDDAPDEVAPGCGCGSGSQASRLQVAHNVIDYLYDEAEPGTLGRTELDAMAYLIREYDLPRTTWKDLAGSLAQFAHTPRYPTEQRLAGALDAIADPAALVFNQLIGGDETARSEISASPITMVALARVSVFGRGLARLGSDLRADRRLLIPLDDLLSLELTDRSLVDAVRRGEQVPAVVLQRQRDRVRGWLPSILEIRQTETSVRVVRMMATLAALWRRRFEELGEGWSPAIPGETLKEQVAAIRDSLWARR